MYLNSYFQAGIKSPLDDAILKHEHPAIAEYEKVDEIPFDFIRKRLSVVARRGERAPPHYQGRGGKRLCRLRDRSSSTGLRTVRRKPASPSGRDLSRS